MAQYIFTDLPQYVKVQSRTEFSSSVVSSGAVLLFSEDGYTLTGKLPDGTFITIGGGSGTAPVGNATSGDLLAGKSATVSGGAVISGTIPTVSATSSGSQISVPSGYIEIPQSFTVSSGIDVSSTTAEAADVLSGKIFYTSGGVMTSGTIPTVAAYTPPPISHLLHPYVVIPAGYHSTDAEFYAYYFTGDVDATSDDVRMGKTFVDSSGYYQQGFMREINSSSYTPTTSDQIISSGVYLGGSQVILGDANLVASNIASGVTIFGVTGSHQGPTDFYKCASITSGGSVWTGYKAVLSGGSYSFESAVTSGLSYGDGFIPQVDKIYADGALVKTELFMGNSIPQNGLVFYAPLSQSAATAETGQALTGSPASFTTYLDVPCAQFNGSQYMESEMTNIPYSENPFSISMWINLASNTSGDRGLLGIGTAEAGGLIAIISKSSGITLSGHGNGYGWDNAGPAAFTFNGEWHHLAIVFAQGNGGSRTASMYMDGSLLKSASFIYDPEVYSWGGNHFYIDSYWGGTWVQNCPCLMAALRLYNRELTSDEITALGTEFTPSA